VPTTSIAVLTRDLRVHDNPVLSRAAASADRVVPLFVLDTAILRSAYNRANRAQFLAESLAGLDSSLRGRGAGLVVRRGRWAPEVAGLAQETGAHQVHVAGDVTAYARTRLDDLAARLPDDVGLVVHDDALLVVPPGEVAAAGKDHMSVFTPYFRKWEQIPLRALVPIRMENLIPAAKNIGTTHITNGCYRLHPVEWGVGEVAGTLAAFCLERRCTPQQVCADRDLLEQLQARLVRDGVEVRWPEVRGY